MDGLKENCINVIIGCNENYVFPAQVMLDSLYFHNKKKKIAIWLLYSNISKTGLEKLKNQVEKFEWRFSAVKIPEYIDRLLDGFPVLEHFSKDMYYRLFLPWLLIDCDKVLYIDVDTMVRADIEKFYNNMPNDNSLLVAVPEMDLRVRSEGKIRLDLDDCEYFNSGVQLLFLDKIRAVYKLDDFTKKIVSIVNAYTIQCPDQDVMNIVYKGRITAASKFWNYGATNSIVYKILHRKELKKAKIVHFTRSKKPWMNNYVLFYLFEYWKYLKNYLTLKQKLIYWICKPIEAVKFARLMIMARYK